MVTGFSRGNPIKYINNIWQYEDGVPLDREERPCTRCGRMPNKDGSDACLGYIEGATSGCCGHGKENGYIVYDNEINIQDKIKIHNLKFIK
jgi:hypothetical protein